MLKQQVFTRCLVPTVLAAVATDTKEKAVSDNKIDPKLCRPSELPLYTPDPIHNVKQIDDSESNQLEEVIRATRLKLVEINKEVEAYKRVGVEQFEKGKDELDWVVNYLRQEDNTLPKVGAIGIGGLTGLIFGLRGGFIKKTVYAAVGALGISAVCYPKEASEYSQVALTEGKKYAVVAYNFVHGVKKDDPPLELPSLPKLPTSLDEAWESVKSFVSSDSSEKTPEKSKDQQ
uniref:MICOS complex subunit n=1 Tax=Diabrotica virgifera virgifera TaxID=50390 RepID=A0A6P7FT98_DIAVI